MNARSQGACEKRRMVDQVSDNPPLNELCALILVDASLITCSFIQRWQHFSYPSPLAETRTYPRQHVQHLRTP